MHGLHYFHGHECGLKVTDRLRNRKLFLPGGRLVVVLTHVMKIGEYQIPFGDFTSFPIGSSIPIKISIFGHVTTLPATPIVHS